MADCVSEISSSIQFEAAKVLVLRNQCGALLKRVMKVCSSGSYENDSRLIVILKDIRSFFVKLQRKGEIFNSWLKGDLGIADLNSRLDRFDSEHVQCIQTEIESDETDLRSFVISSIQEYSTLQSNESRIFNEEMMSNLNLIGLCKEEAPIIQLRVYDANSLQIDTERSSFLGQGGFGSVRKGLFRGIQVAVKRVHSFPGVIHLFGVDDAIKPTIMVMELAVCSLYSALHEKKHKMDLSENRKVELIHSMCSTLSFLHSVGIVHRDIKSGNFLMMSDGSVKVADFGLAKAKVLRPTAGRDLKGTDVYLAPELLMQSDPPYVYTEATDMYSFGVLMNEVMTNEVPHKDLPNFLPMITRSGGSLRPELYSGALRVKLEPLITACWNVESSKRGDFFQLCFLLSQCLPSPTDISDSLETIDITDKFLASDTGGYYTGQMKGSAKHGEGTLRCLNGLVYQGTWKNNQLNGFGVRTGPDFNYEGQYRNFNREGHGVMTYADGGVYDGEWKDGVFEGHGVMRYADGDVYDGEWKDDCKEGHGVMRYADGGVYDGEWKDDGREGHGVMRYASGTVYDGEWKDDCKEGHGVMRYADGDVYDGGWKGGVLEGQGVMRYASGTVYHGEWKDDCKEGRGVMTYASGTVYDGEWKGGVLEGQGVMRYADGGVYDGAWKNDAPNGHGVMTYASGTVYDGEWKDGVFEGHGVIGYADSDVYDGGWKSCNYVDCDSSVRMG